MSLNVMFVITIHGLVQWDQSTTSRANISSNICTRNMNEDFSLNNWIYGASYFCCLTTTGIHYNAMKTMLVHFHSVLIFRAKFSTFRSFSNITDNRCKISCKAQCLQPVKILQTRWVIWYSLYKLYATPNVFLV